MSVYWTSDARTRNEDQLSGSHTAQRVSWSAVETLAFLVICLSLGVLLGAWLS